MTDFTFCLIIFGKINIVFYWDKNLIMYTYFYAYFRRFKRVFVYQINRINTWLCLRQKVKFLSRNYSKNIPSSFSRRKKKESRGDTYQGWIYFRNKTCLSSMFPRFFRGNARFMTRTCYHKRVRPATRDQAIPNVPACISASVKSVSGKTKRSTISFPSPSIQSTYLARFFVSQGTIKR